MEPVVPAALSLVVIIMPRRPRDFGYDRSSESTPISFTPLRRLQAAIVLGPVSPLELLGAEVSQRRVGPCPVVEALDVLEDLERRPLSALEGAGVHALRLDEPHERLHRRVVPRARDRARRRPDAGLAHRLAYQERDVLRHKEAAQARELLLTLRRASEAASSTTPPSTTCSTPSRSRGRSRRRAALTTTRSMSRRTRC